MRRPDLAADCVSCAALCCVAPSFEASEDFAFAKAAGVPCPNLAADGRCQIHEELESRGFGGCAVYDCYGAGPRATRAFPAGSVRDEARRDEAFLVLRVVCEWLWMLTEAAERCPPARADLQGLLAREVEALDALASAQGLAILEVDPGPHVEKARAILRQLGEALGGRHGSARGLAEPGRPGARERPSR